MNNQKYLYRHSKITPTKIGQFVTLWKRDSDLICQPFEEKDDIEVVIIDCSFGDNFGYFEFGDSILLEKGIIRSSKLKGKNGFRVYPAWDIPDNSTAIKTQKWQLQYFKTI